VERTHRELIVGMWDWLAKAKGIWYKMDARRKREERKGGQVAGCEAIEG